MYNRMLIVEILESGMPILRWMIGILRANGYPNRRVLNAIAQYQIPTDSCDWHKGSQWNPVHQIWYYALLTSYILQYHLIT
jgi:hypothetical protein